MGVRRVYDDYEHLERKKRMLIKSLEAYIGATDISQDLKKFWYEVMKNLPHSAPIRELEAQFGAIIQKLKIEVPE